MAAPTGSKMFLLRDAYYSTSVMFRSGKMSFRMIPSRQLSLQHSSRLHKCARCQTSVNVQRPNASRKVFGITFVRHASTTTQADIPYVPDVPAPPEVTTGLSDDLLLSLPELNAIGEPTLSSLGLGSNYPPGLFQQLIEFIHVNADVPWFMSIMSAVLLVRLCFFPLMVYQQRHIANYSKHKEEMRRLQEGYDEAKMSQDPIETMKKSQELRLFIKTKNLSPWKPMLPLITQMPVYISAYFGLRKMSELPVASMTDGGVGWFQDLTVMDPFFILPVIGAGVLAINFELGAESASTKTMGHGQRWAMRGMTGVFLAVTSFMPSAITLYFAMNNFLTLTQAALLRAPPVRNKLSLPPMETQKNNQDNKGFVEGFVDMWDKMKLKKGMTNWRLTDEEQFKKAGIGPVPKTYRYNPKEVRTAA